MTPITHNPLFWLELDKLVSENKVVIDRPRGSVHPRFPDFAYPVDYGYIEGTRAVDGGAVDIWVGTALPKTIDAIMCTIDPAKKDVEIKVLYGCTPEEKKVIYEVHNRKMKGILIERA